MCHEAEFDAKFLEALGKIDAAYAKQVQEAGCPVCGGALDRANYPRKPRGDLGEASAVYAFRLSFCCRCDGCRRRATPASLRFLGRRVYIAVVVVVASISGRAMQLTGRGRAKHVRGVPIRTVRRWLAWWEMVFALSAFWTEAQAFLGRPVSVMELPASLLARFGAPRTAALERMLRFTAPITTTSVRARIAMVG